MSTTTARRSWSRPQKHDRDWDTGMQGIIDDLDTRAAFSNATLTYTAVQTFGNGLTVDGQTELRVTSPLILTSSPMSLVNGTNSDVNVGFAAHFLVLGPSAPFTITGFANTGVSSPAGRIIVVYNTTVQAMTLANETTSSNNNRITTMTGSNIVLGGQSIAVLFYTDSRWKVLVARG